MQWEACVDPAFSGCVRVRLAGETVLTVCRGYAELANRLPNTMDTRFQTASAGKAFVAAGVLRLVERGTLALDDTLGRLLPMDWEAIDPAVTVGQLLCHTSGIPDYYDESEMGEYSALWLDFPNYKIRRSSDLLPLFLHKPMQHPAGARFQYNNAGYVVLGLILEQAAGLPFDQVLEQEVFGPCGMADTGYFALDRLPARCASAYLYDGDREEYYTNIYSVDVKGTGAGGAFTTLPDVSRFWEGLFSGKLLSDGMVRAMCSPQARSETECYGYGLWLDPDGRGGYTPHFEGCDPDVSFISSFDPRRGLEITAVSNFGQNVWQIHRELLRKARAD